MPPASFETALDAARRLNGDNDVVLTSLFAALADLAADNLEPTADHTRTLLANACDRITDEWGARPAVCHAINSWRRTVAFFPARDARAMRCFAIREAEKRLRDGGAVTVAEPFTEVRSTDAQP